MGDGAKIDPGLEQVNRGAVPRVSGLPHWLLNSACGSRGSSPVSVRCCASSRAVSGQSGQMRSLRPLPRNFTLGGGVNRRSVVWRLTISCTRAPVLNIKASRT